MILSSLRTAPDRSVRTAHRVESNRSADPYPLRYGARIADRFGVDVDLNRSVWTRPARLTCATPEKKTTDPIGTRKLPNATEAPRPGPWQALPDARRVTRGSRGPDAVKRHLVAATAIVAPNPKTSAPRSYLPATHRAGQRWTLDTRRARSSAVGLAFRRQRAPSLARRPGLAPWRLFPVVVRGLSRW